MSNALFFISSLMSFTYFMLHLRRRCIFYYIILLRTLGKHIVIIEFIEHSPVQNEIVLKKEMNK